MLLIELIRDQDLISRSFTHLGLSPHSLLFSQIKAWLCGSPDTSNFWPYVLSLSDLISHSTEASKEAARSLRKEFKYSTNSSPRIRAARVWGILSLNASDRFKMQIAEKKFLNVVEETIKNKETQLEVKEMLLKTLAMLAWQVSLETEIERMRLLLNISRLAKLVSCDFFFSLSFLHSSCARTVQERQRLLFSH